MGAVIISQVAGDHGLVWPALQKNPCSAEDLLCNFHHWRNQPNCRFHQVLPTDICLCRHQPRTPPCSLPPPCLNLRSAPAAGVQDSDLDPSRGSRRPPPNPTACMHLGLAMPAVSLHALRSPATGLHCCVCISGKIPQPRKYTLIAQVQPYLQSLAFTTGLTYSQLLQLCACTGPGLTSDTGLPAMHCWWSPAVTVVNSTRTSQLLVGLASGYLLSLTCTPRLACN